jgi:hypothetical protein
MFALPSANQVAGKYVGCDRSGSGVECISIILEI